MRLNKILLLSALFLVFGCKENTQPGDTTSGDQVSEAIAPKQDKLDNQTAMAILQENFKRNCKQKLWIGKDTHRGRFRDKQKLKKLEDLYSQLANDGLLTIKDYGDFFQGQFTSKGLSTFGINNIYNDRVTVARTEIVEIIGISQTDADATVRFSYRYAPTRVYDMRQYINDPGKDNCPNGILEEKIQLKRYDTGWLIEH